MKLGLIFVLFFTILNAQKTTENVFSLKPAIGINGCQIHGDSYAGYDKFGIFGGAAINARLNKEKSSIELGFYFSQKGSRHNPTKNDPSYYRLHLNYIDLPLSIRYRVNSGYFITAGPSVSYLVSYNEYVNYADFTGMYSYNRFEAGINFGLGRKIREKWSIELRCSNSVTPVRNIIAPIYYPNPVARFFNKGYYSNILTLFVSYQIGINNKPPDGEE
jgi:hypothetical protein